MAFKYFFTIHIHFNVYDIFKKNMKSELDLVAEKEVENYVNSEQFNFVLDYYDIDDSVKKSFLNEDFDIKMKYIYYDKENINFIGVDENDDNVICFELKVGVDIDNYIVGE